MTPRQIIKFSCFTLEGLNSFATVFYFNYLYFLMRDEFGYGNKRNLALAAALGLVYAISAVQTGKFAQHRGYFAALKAGFSIMAIWRGTDHAVSNVRSLEKIAHSQIQRQSRQNPPVVLEVAAE